MIVPRNSLLFWVALVALPLTLLAALAPPLAPAALGGCALLALVALFDAFVARGRLAGLRVELPPVARMTRDRGAKLEVRVRNPTLQPQRLRLGIAWPGEIETSEPELDVNLPAGVEISRLEWPCLPRRRGRYELAGAHVEAASPAGLWNVRAKLPADSEIRVYPNLARERRGLAALFLHRGAYGLHTQRQVGQGREFEKLREYIPGDSFSEVHWKATARRGRPISKVFQIERTQEVYLVLDTSRLSARDTPGPGGEAGTGLERMITAALVLCLAAEQQGDLFGLITFSDTVSAFIRAKNGQAHYNAVRDALYTVQPRTVSPDFDELCTTIRLRLRRRALLVFLTALDDPEVASGFVRNAELLARQHLVLVNMIQPPGVRPLFSDSSVPDSAALYEQLGGHVQWQRLREIERVLQRRGAQFHLLANERLSAELVSHYLRVKQRQLL